MKLNVDNKILRKLYKYKTTKLWWTKCQNVKDFKYAVECFRKRK